MKFGTYVGNQSPDMTPEKKLRKLGVVRVTWPLIFGVLHANSSKVAKGANLKFGMRHPRQSPDVTFEKNSQKGGGIKVGIGVVPNYGAIAMG